MQLDRRIRALEEKLRDWCEPLVVVIHYENPDGTVAETETITLPARGRGDVVLGNDYETRHGKRSGSGSLKTTAQTRKEAPGAAIGDRDGRGYRRYS